MAPDPVEQRVLRDQYLRHARERAQHFEWPRRQRDGTPVEREAGVGLVEFELIEAHPQRVLR